MSQISPMTIGKSGVLPRRCLGQVSFISFLKFHVVSPKLVPWLIVYFSSIPLPKNYVCEIKMLIKCHLPMKVLLWSEIYPHI